MKNPYHHRATNPHTTMILNRARLIAPIVKDLIEGADNVLLTGGYGTGKTVLLEQLRAQICEVAGAHAVVIDHRSAFTSVTAVVRSIFHALRISQPEIAQCLAADPLAGADLHRQGDLSDDVVERLDLAAFLGALCELRGYQPLVLMFDELDKFADSTDGPAIARGLFNRLENVTRQLKRQVAVLAAGGIGVVGLRSRVGSQFAQNARLHQLSPFDEAEQQQLLAPFEADGRPLPEDVFGALRSLSGAHPSLFVYGLRELWPLAVPSREDVASAYARLVTETSFIDDYWATITSPQVSLAAEKLLDAIKRSQGAISQRDAQDAVEAAAKPLPLSVDDVLRLLLAAGLVRLSGSMHTDPVQAAVIPSILHRPSSKPSPQGDLRAQLVSDVVFALKWFADQSSDFFARATRDAKGLVQEKTFSSVIAFSLQRGGWDVRREEQGGTGPADVRAHHPLHDGEAIVEVKTWGEDNGYEDVHLQAVDYWSSGTRAAAVVMLRVHVRRADWPKEYRATCLDGKAARSEQLADLPPLSAHFLATSPLDGGREAVVDHLLLRIPVPEHA